MKRRDFLKSSLFLAAAASFSKPSDLLAQAGAYPDVAVVSGNRDKATVEAINMIGGIGRFVKAGSKVVIKPNMSFNSPPETGANTHPDVVAAVVRLCKDAGASKISVLDNTFSSKSPHTSGILAACNQISANCVNIVSDKRFYQEVPVNGKVLKQAHIIKEVLDADVIIAVPKAKAHSSTGVSLTLKGSMGLIYDRMFFHSYGLNDCITDLYSVLKPTFTVIDASNVMTTNGPNGPGKMIIYNQVIASVDSVAADAYAAASYEWYGKKVKPENVAHLREAASRGLGRIDINNMNIATKNV